MILKKKIRIISIALIISTIFLPTLASGEVAWEDSKNKLLQQSLSIYEIDQELQRLMEHEQNMVNQIADTEKHIAEQDELVQYTRKHAGETLRAYYMGERQTIWLALFTARSFSDLLRISEYLFMILDNDQRSLENYTTSYNQLKQLQVQLENELADLQNTKASFLVQRARIVALEKEREEQLAREKDAALLIQQSEQLIENWKNIGMPLFKYYFQELSIAMSGLPNILVDPEQQFLTFSGLNAKFQISDRQFNQFLHTENENLLPLTFSFQEDQMTITGDIDGLAIQIIGHYTLQKTEDNTAIMFHVDKLVYDGFDLPDTTAKALEKEFMLGFYPDSYAAFLEATDLKISNQALTLHLKLKL